MSEQYDILNDVVQDRAPGTTDAVLNLSTGATLSAEIETNLDPFTLPEEFARDPRDKIRLNVQDNNQAMGLTKGDIIRATFGGASRNYILVDGKFSVAGIMSTFLAIEKFDGKDS